MVVYSPCLRNHRMPMGWKRRNFLEFSVMSVSTSSYSNYYTGPRSAVGNVSGYRCVSDCRSRGFEFHPGPVPYFRGD